MSWGGGGAGHGPMGKLEMETEGHKLKSDLFQALPTWSVPEQKALCWESWAVQSEEKMGDAVESREGEEPFSQPEYGQT